MVVSNASPIIILSSIGQLQILPQIFQNIFIAQEVYDEVVGGGSLPGGREITAAAFFEVKRISRTISHIQNRYHIGKGEAATIILAQELGAELVLMDDKRARDTAKVFHLNFIGTLKVLELGFERGIIPDLRQVYGDLLHSKARIAPQLINHSLAKYKLAPL